MARACIRRVGAVQRRVDVQCKVHHVCLLQQVDLRLQDLSLRVDALDLQELEEREHQVPVQVLANLQTTHNTRPPPPL